MEHTAPFYLTKFDGNSIGTTADTYRPIGANGQKTRSVKYNPRTIIAEFGIVGIKDGRYSDERLKKAWQNIGRVMLPDSEGTITFRNDCGTYTIKARPLSLPNLERVLSAVGKFKVEFVADEPFWETSTQFVCRVGQVVKNAKYPLSYPIVYGKFFTETIIDNDTNIPLPVTIEITTEASYVKIINVTTGDFIQVDNSLAKNQKMIVNTKDASVIIQTLDDAGSVIAKDNANYRLTVDSTPDMTLAVGKNQFIIENGSSGSKVTASIFYRKRLLVI